MSSTEEASSSPLNGCDLLTAKSLNIGAESFGAQNVHWM